MECTLCYCVGKGQWLDGYGVFLDCVQGWILPNYQQLLLEGESHDEWPDQNKEQRSSLPSGAVNRFLYLFLIRCCKICAWPFRGCLVIGGEKMREKALAFLTGLFRGTWWWGIDLPGLTYCEDPALPNSHGADLHVEGLYCCTLVIHCDL